MKLKPLFVGILLSIIFVSCINAQQYDFPILKGHYLGQKPPGIFAPGIISTKDNIEFAGTFSPDLREFFFTRSRMVHLITVYIM